MKQVLLLALALAALAPAAARAYSPDDKPDAAENAKDHPMIPGFPGAIITEYEQHEFDEYDLPVKMPDDDDPKTKKVEGRYTRLVYDNPAKASVNEIVRNYQAALSKAGFKILVDKKFHIDHRRLTAELDRAGKVWADFDVWRNTDDSVLTTMIVVDGKRMEQKVALDANAMLDEINRTGHVAVYGITFATGKADISLESAQVLGEIGKLLADNPDLRLRVEGHTDNVGKSKDNLALSKKRAQSVAQWLVKTYKVSAARLVADGFGDAKPVADNGSDEGKAKNRRVELVKL